MYHSHCQIDQRFVFEIKRNEIGQLTISLVSPDLVGVFRKLRNLYYGTLTTTNQEMIATSWLLIG